jgi:hypothetical protein
MLLLSECKKNRIQQIVDTAPVLGRNWKNLTDSQPMKIVGESCLFVGINFIDCEKKRLSGALQQSRKLKVRPSEFTAAIDNHHNGSGFIERDSRLAEDFSRDEIRFFRNNAAGINDAKTMPTPMRFSVEAVTSDARFVADNRPARSDQTVE